MVNTRHGQGKDQHWTKTSFGNAEDHLQASLRQWLRGPRCTMTSVTLPYGEH